MSDKRSFYAELKRRNVIHGWPEFGSRLVDHAAGQQSFANVPRTRVAAA
jgi:hypothetical protein